MKKILIFFFLWLVGYLAHSQNIELYYVLKYKYHGTEPDTTHKPTGFEIDYPHVYLQYDTTQKTIQVTTFYHHKHYISVMIDNQKVLDHVEVFYNKPVIFPMGKGWILVEGKEITRKGKTRTKFKQSYFLK